MITELRQRAYDGKWSVWGLVSIQRENPDDWADKNTPLQSRWIQLKVYDFVGDLVD